MFQSAVIHAEYAFTNHNAVVNGVCYNRHQDCFVSSDDTCLRLWSPLKGELRRVELPPRTNNFIQAIEYIESRQVYVAAALDGTLKLYDANLSELASVFTGRSAILSLVFDAKHSRLLSGGVDGCAAWLVRGKPLGATENGVNPHYELSPLPTFFSPAPQAPSGDASSSSPREHDAEESSTIGSPRAVAVSGSPDKRKASGEKAATLSGSGAVGHSKKSSVTPALPPPHRRAWVQKLQLNSDRTRLYAQSKQCIDVFSTADGRFLETYAELFPKEYGAIMAFVVHEKTHYIVCGCLNGWIFVVSLHPVSVVHIFKDHTLRVTGLAVHASSQLILSSSLDGTVRLWDLEARRQAHRLDIGQPVHAIELLVPHVNPCRFYCRVRSAIELFRIQSTIKEHLPALSPICVLQRVLPPAHDAGGADTLTAKAASLHAAAAAARARGGECDSPSSDDDSDGGAAPGSGHNGDDDDSGDYETRDRRSQQVILAAGMDKTIRLFAGHSANEAPSFTWIPEEAALDVIGFALHPVGNHLFLLLESQKIVVVDVSVRDKEDSAIVRIVDISANVAALGANGSSRTSSKPSATSSINSSRDATLASSGGASPHRSQFTSSSSNATSATHSSSSSSSSWSGAPRGGIKCLCVCYYPPIFRSAASNTAATAHVTPAAQSKWFSRTFVNRRQPSSAAQELKRLEEEYAAATAATATESGSGGRRRNALVQSEYEWIVCGSEFGHLLFWHTGLANSGREAITIDAHDAGIVAVATSTSSPLLVSLDDAHRVHVWHFQPIFMLLHMLELHDRPSCFVLSPRSELLLSGYDDGNVVLMDLRDVAAGAGVQTFAQDDERHFAMVSAGDFLDEKALVLTASVDAVVKVWDHEKNLLRQLSLAMAFTSLCFMNAGGDVMAGLSNGIFIVTREDVLPEKPPTTKHSKPRRRDGASQQRDHALSNWHAASSGGDNSAGKAYDHVVLEHSSQHQHSHHSPLNSLGKLTAVSSSACGSSMSGIVDSPTTKTDRKPERTESTSIQQPQPPTAGRPQNTGASWKKPRAELTKWLTYEDRPVATQEPPPALRPLPSTAVSKLLSETVELRAPTYPVRAHSRRQRRREPLGQVLPLISSDDKEEDWREQLMPSSPYRLASAAAAASGTITQRHLRRKTQVPASPLVLQTLNQSPRSRQTLVSSAATGTSDSDSTQEKTPGLGIGADLTTSSAPLQYCKHQAPVPPKEKTPRKLWNAIGGEDRRLIVLQRNVQQF